jgi:hypothetical protein
MVKMVSLPEPPFLSPVMLLLSLQGTPSLHRCKVLCNILAFHVTGNLITFVAKVYTVSYQKT